MSSKNDLILALEIAKERGLRINIDGMSLDDAANYVVDVLIRENCLDKKQYRRTTQHQ